MAKNVTRRNLMQAAAAGAAVAGLAACSSDTEETTDDATEEVEEAEADATDALAAPDTSSYPIDPDGDDVEALWSAEDTGDGYYLVTQGDGTTLGIADTSKLIQVSGYAFKDLNGNGVLDVWEDWRQDSATRAQAVAEELVETDLNVAFMQLNSAGWADTTVDPSTLSESSLMSVTATDELTDDQKQNIEVGAINRMNFSFTSAPAKHVPWYNLVQAYAEECNLGIPVTIETEASPGDTTGNWTFPSAPTLATTFDPDNTKFVAQAITEVVRNYGGHRFNSPQIDVGTEPTWDRNSGTYCCDPALGRDMARAFIDGAQSTYDDDGNDLGWGSESMVCNMKHFPGDGSAQNGGNSHWYAERFGIYPGGNFKANWVPFIDGAMHLDGKTEQVGSAMPFYSIPYTDDEEYGELVGGGFSKYIMSVGRAYGFEGMYSSDWQIIDNRYWGVEDLSVAQRIAKSFEAGMSINCGPIPNFNAHWEEALGLIQDDLGEDGAAELVTSQVAAIQKASFNLGLYENPYLSVDSLKAALDHDEWDDEIKRIHNEGIVMLKNDDVLTSEAGLGDKPKVYIPVRYAGTAASYAGFLVTTASDPASFPFDEETISEYFDYVTDPIPESAESNDDIERLTAEDVADCEYAIVYVEGPSSGTTYEENDDGSYTIWPRTLQYREFVADADSGCLEESIAGIDAANPDYVNYSPYGNSMTATNEYDLDTIEYVASIMPEGAKIIVLVDTSQPSMCFHEFEADVDCILWGNSVDADDFLDILTGAYEPTGLLAWQMPASMNAVYAQNNDTPRDCECYTDSAGNTYDFAFGLNWSGVIDDERTATYKVSPLLEPESTMDESLLVYE